MRYPISIPTKQLLKLFFTPDIFNFYSPAYAWFVNQAGHALIGLLIALLMHTALVFLGASIITAFAFVAAAGLLIYGLKELNDYRQARQLDAQAPAVLRVNPAEIVLDMLADWSFVNSGVLTGAALSAWYLSGFTAWLVAAAIFTSSFVLFMLAYGPIYLTNKLLWQKSRLPRLHDIAHCKPALLHQNLAHFQQQVQKPMQSAHYCGDFDNCEAVIVGLARRVIVQRKGSQRRVRYWQQDEWLSALASAPTSSSPEQPWSLDECDVLLVWLSKPMPTLTDAQLARLQQKTLLLASDNFAHWWQGTLTEVPVQEDSVQ